MENILQLCSGEKNRHTMENKFGFVFVIVEVMEELYREHFAASAFIPHVLPDLIKLMLCVYCELFNKK